jgi:hypothetical protein
MTKRERLDALRKENMRVRAETRENEMYTREGEEFTIQMIRDKMERALNDTEMEAEARKEKLALFKEEIETILDARDEREHDFIEQELKRHQLEHELEQEIQREEQAEKAEEQGDDISIVFKARSSLAASAEQMRKSIEESRRELNEAEQFSTILINNSERDAIPSFATSRRKKREAKAPEQIARIDTVVIKQREIGMMYRESQELQEIQLKKLGKKPNENE